jgi:hypothetical protein
MEEALYSDSLIAGAMTMALCYLNRMDKEHELREETLSSRILVIKGSEDNPEQYMNFMNAYLNNIEPSSLLPLSESQSIRLLPYFLKQCSALDLLFGHSYNRKVHIFRHLLRNHLMFVCC